MFVMVAPAIVIEDLPFGRASSGAGTWPAARFWPTLGIALLAGLIGHISAAALAGVPDLWRCSHRPPLGLAPARARQQRCRRPCDPDRRDHRHPAVLRRPHPHRRLRPCRSSPPAWPRAVAPDGGPPPGVPTPSAGPPTTSWPRPEFRRPTQSPLDRIRHWHRQQIAHALDAVHRQPARRRRHHLLAVVVVAGRRDRRPPSPCGRSCQRVSGRRRRRRSAGTLAGRLAGRGRRVRGERRLAGRPALPLPGPRRRARRPRAGRGDRRADRRANTGRRSAPPCPRSPATSAGPPTCSSVRYGDEPAGRRRGRLGLRRRWPTRVLAGAR